MNFAFDRQDADDLFLDLLVFPAEGQRNGAVDPVPVGSRTTVYADLAYVPHRLNGRSQIFDLRLDLLICARICFYRVQQSGRCVKVRWSKIFPLLC